MKHNSNCSRFLVLLDVLESLDGEVERGMCPEIVGFLAFISGYWFQGRVPFLVA